MTEAECRGAELRAVRRTTARPFRLKTVTFRGVPRHPWRVGHPEGAVAIAREILSRLDADREHLLTLALDRKKQVIGFKVSTSGTFERSLADPAVILRDALALGASSVVIVHNHPSGDPEPSADDIAVSRRLARAGEIIGIPLTDSIVLGAGGLHVSLRAHEHQADAIARSALNTGGGRKPGTARRTSGGAAEARLALGARARSRRGRADGDRRPLQEG